MVVEFMFKNISYLNINKNFYCVKEQNEEFLN